MTFYSTPKWCVPREEQVRNDLGTVVVPIMPELKPLASCDIDEWVRKIVGIAKCVFVEYDRFNLVVRPIRIIGAVILHPRYKHSNMQLLSLRFQNRTKPIPVDG